MKVTHGDPRIMVLFDEHGEALATCVSIEARDRLIEAVNRGVGVTDPESDRLVDELFADARARPRGRGRVMGKQSDFARELGIWTETPNVMLYVEPCENGIVLRFGASDRTSEDAYRIASFRTERLAFGICPELEAKLAAAEARAEKLKKDNAGMVNIITELQNDAAAIRPLLRRAYRYVSANAIDARAEGGDE